MENKGWQVLEEAEQELQKSQKSERSKSEIGRASCRERV